MAGHSYKKKKAKAHRRGSRDKSRGKCESTDDGSAASTSPPSSEQKEQHVENKEERWDHIVVHRECDFDMPRLEDADDGDVYLHIMRDLELSCFSALNKLESKWKATKVPFDPSHVDTFEMIGRRIGFMWFARKSNRIVLRASVIVQPANATLADFIRAKTTPSSETPEVFIGLPCEGGTMHMYAATDTNLLRMVRKKFGRFDTTPPSGNELLVQYVPQMSYWSDLGRKKEEFSEPKVALGSIVPTDESEGNAACSVM